MRKITAKNAKYLRPGTKLMMIGFNATGESSRSEKFLLTYVVSKSVARKTWRKEYTELDVWYYYPDTDGCYTMIDSGNESRIMWDEIYSLTESEFKRLSVLSAL